ncbi:prion-like-(Q/N-rich) domain-bearing protein 25 isoform X1 [Atheta coriaria]|uniref:prion-like-(Q/N-rich) domain-bearing protein 25 isoform X1 n=1 Tax=Dalotia coriaria TaxID=877792 RepID=UPI0031F3663B
MEYEIFNEKNSKYLKMLFILLIITQTICVYAQQDQSLARKIVSYQTCKLDADCKISHSYCDGNSATTNGLCKCEEGFIIIRSRQSFDCVTPAASVDSECTYDEQCELALGKHAECDERKKCNCMPHAHFVKSKNSCFSTSRLNETCLSDDNCIPNHPSDKVFCTNGRCTCGLKQAPNSAGKCVVVRRLGEECKNDDACLSMNAVCRVTCTCRVGYVLETDERYCLKAADKLFDACTQESQCQEYFQHSECVRGRCQCKTQYHQYGNNCYSPSKIGSLCRHKGECITSPDLEGRVDCINSICLCKSGLDSLSCGDISATSRLRNYQEMQVIALLFSTFIFLLI